MDSAITRSSGSMMVNASCGPEAAMDSRPALTTLALPLTGQTSRDVPRSVAASRTSWEASADTDDESTR
ncbi:MAG: hypothetical protein QOD87_176 [Pseudonocardiales bacterium]|nr:hypothetical protein [Pseudonocardiales bacterium]